MANEQINSRLVEIYQTLNRIEELADDVLYNPLIDNAIKEAFLNWYESKFDALKEELFEYKYDLWRLIFFFFLIFSF